VTEPPPEPLAQWVTATDGAQVFFHASAVALDGAGVLILGPSGSGKSSLALELIALGAELICDDGVWLADGRLRRPASAPALIEARGIGLLNAGPLREDVPLKLVIDLARAEPERLPPRRMAVIGAEKVTLILGAGQPTLAPAILHLLRFGRAAP